jgi:hypothetical protein
MAKQAKVNALPEFVAFKTIAGVKALVTGEKAPAQARFPTSDPKAIALTIKSMIAAKVAVSEYAFFCPKYDANGEMIKALDDKGNFILGKNNRAQLEQIELSKAIKEIEEGKREAVLVFGRFGTFRVNILSVESPKAKTKKGDEYFDLAAFFSTKK